MSLVEAILQGSGISFSPERTDVGVNLPRMPGTTFRQESKG